MSAPFGRAWPSSELLDLAEKAKAAGNNQTYMLIVSGCRGFQGDQLVPVSAMAAALLERLEVGDA